MFELITQSMLFLLESLKNIVGNYGLAIIALTVLVRVVLWPVSKSQIKSMKMMQDLQPKMKQIQERFKGDPQKLQIEMMKLYKDYKFNPLGGCLPMLVQLPLFIGLYWAISNPHFMTAADPTFLNFIHLKHTGIISHAGPSEDGMMSLSQDGGGFLGTGKDRLMAGNKMTIRLTNGKILEQNVPSPNKALTILPKEPRPGIPLTVTTDYAKLNLEGYENLVSSITMPVTNTASKELETLKLKPSEHGFKTKLETEAGKTVLNLDVLLLVIIFATSMIFSQKAMSNPSANTMGEQQQQMMKMMPIMFSVFLFIFPIPAGVLLYMDTNSLFQIFQTWFFQWEDKRKSLANQPAPSQQLLDITPDPQA